MADRASKRGKSKGDGPATLPAAQLPPGMPPEMFTASGMLALADLLPVMTAYVDRDERRTASSTSRSPNGSSSRARRCSGGRCAR